VIPELLLAKVMHFYQLKFNFEMKTSIPGESVLPQGDR